MIIFLIKSSHAASACNRFYLLHCLVISHQTEKWELGRSYQQSIRTDQLWALQASGKVTPPSPAESFFILLNSSFLQHSKPVKLEPEFAEALAENRKEIPKLYAQILGYLSPYRYDEVYPTFLPMLWVTDCCHTRLPHIDAAFFKELGATSQKTQITKNKIAVLEGMRFLQLKVS